MKFIITVLICKVLSFAGRILGGGTDMPGRIATKIYPHIMSRLKISGKIIAVTGSNGKTTTSNIIAHVLRESGFSVVNNEMGANMTSGIASTLLCACSITGKINCDYIVLEVDECYTRFIFEDLPIDYYLVLNLLRDQVVRNGNPDLVFEKIAESVSKRPDMILLLNSNDPISQNLAGKNKVVYFEMERTSRSTDVCVSGINDCKICPKCFHKMEYDFFHYNHIGKFYCTHCDYASHTPDFYGTDIDFENKTLKINDEKIEVTYNTTYNIFNTIAAAAACCTAGISIEQFAESVKNFFIAKERFDSFEFDGRKTTLLMTKQNAASLDQSISYVLEQEGEKIVVLFINNALYVDYKDISWLYDVAFLRLKGKINNIVCLGNRAIDAAVCMKAAGFEGDVLIYENEDSGIKEALRKTQGDIYILAASAFGHENKILEALKK